MLAPVETLYREAPLEPLGRIDPAAIPDCGLSAVERLRRDHDALEERVPHYVRPAFVSIAAFTIGVLVFTSAPWLVVIGFIAARDVAFLYWHNRERARLTRLAIEELVRNVGGDVIAAEGKLREDVETWNNDAARLEFWSRAERHRDSERAARRYARCHDRKTHLLEEIRRLHARRRPA